MVTTTQMNEEDEEMNEEDEEMNAVNEEDRVELNQEVRDALIDTLT